MADSLITPDGRILEICECGDETCIEWPADSEGKKYISQEEMNKLIAERVKLVATCKRVSKS